MASAEACPACRLFYGRCVCSVLSVDGVWIPPTRLVTVGDAAYSPSSHAKVERPLQCVFYYLLLLPVIMFIIVLLVRTTGRSCAVYVDVLHIIT